MPGEKGQPLPDHVKSKMEDAFGADFSSVRVHTDSSSGNLNKMVSARAFTHGTDIFFKQGQYSPNSEHGHRLIAHELTHVMQQQQGRVKANGASKAQATLKAEAALNGHLVAGGMKAAVHGVSGPPSK